MLRKTHQPIPLAGNKHLSVSGVTELSIGIGGMQIQHTIYVCDDLAQELLLGADFLKQNCCVVNLNTDTITIRGKTCAMIRKTTRTVCRVEVASSRTIPAYSMVNVQCRVEKGSVVENTTGVLEPELKFEERYAMGIIKVAAKVKDGVIAVRMFNAQPKPRRIFKGSTVGELHPIVDSNEENEISDLSCYQVCEPSPQTTGTLFCGGISDVTQEQSITRKEIMELFRVDNPNILSQERNKLYDILERNARVISKGKHDLGDVIGVKHAINTKECTPIRVPPRRIPYHQRGGEKRN